MTINEFISALDRGGYKPRQAGGGWTALCPGHPDRTPSLSISEGSDGRILLKCFAGCDHQRIVAGMGASQSDLFPETRSFATRPSRHYAAPTPRHLTPESIADRAAWPPFENPIDTGTAEENIAFQLLPRLSKLRGISSAGLTLAADRGLLRFCAHAGTLAWVVCDQTRLNAQVRRMDGQQWSEIGGKKAWTMKGSWASWPIGAEESGPYPVILLTEGGPDMLAAHYFICRHNREHDVAAVGMLGAGNNIPGDALLLLAGKRIVICAHTDEAGIGAAMRWASQLENVGATVSAPDLSELTQKNGEPVGDLNDALKISDSNELSDLIPKP